MMLSVLASVLAAIVSATFVTPEMWVANRPALLVAFGIQGAAILTRLGRGHPVGDINHLSPENLQRLNEAVLKIAKEQRRAALVTFAATLAAITINGFHYVLSQVVMFGWTEIPKLQTFMTSSTLVTWVWQVLVFIAVFLIAAALCHLPSIVNQDLGLIELQSRFKNEGLEAAKKKSARETAAAEEMKILLDEIHVALTRDSSTKAPFGEIVDKPPDQTRNEPS